MNDHTLRVLEYDKVAGVVSGFAASEAGRDAVLAFLPAVDAVIVESRLQETSEFIHLLRSNEVPPLDGILNVKAAVQKLGVAGSMLSPLELVNMATTLGAGRRTKNFFHRFEGKGTGAKPQAPLLCAQAAKIQPLKQIEDAVFSAIDDKAEVKDSASPELRKVRKQIVRTREDILGRMSGILQESGFQKVIQEPVITLRDDRYVLPLKPNFRQSLKGIVHGQSGSRSTLFVEPLEILEQNNRLAELRMDEREEVDRILRELTSLMTQEADTIKDTIEALAGIDAVYARARFGIEYEGTVPALSADRTIVLRAARHPLLAVKFKNAIGNKSVITNDIELSSSDHALILSGPNAGGKTVILKMVGLLSLMAQSGMPVTAGEGSELPCFGSVFADIGDEQSLEQDLSTFSSHVKQIADILREADRDSLVLLDELGSGTDPNEGAGLGAAVLEGLIGRGCISLVTTHHNALKLFGSQTSGAVNAAMEFDPRTLKPTYRLIPGRPGRSYGLDMATRLGIPDDVIDRARARISDDDIRLETLLKQVEDDTHLLASERERLEQDRRAAKQERSEAEALLRAAKEEARAVKAKTKEEAREVLSSLRLKLRELSRSAVLEQAEVRKASSEVEDLARKLQPAEQEHQTVSATMPDLRQGDRIKLVRANKTGTVLGSHRGMIEIEVDGKKITLPSRDVLLLEPVSQGQTAGRVPGWGTELHEEEGPPRDYARLNLLGLRVNEALDEVDRFLDHASTRGLSVLTIIHGLGTGALKTAVTKFLKNHPLITAIRPGEPAEGGAGVTVAELKK
ncbi:MAG: endonuclease MutS2 [Nitrospirae bacterium]|nr:endonuclease MutS2 [Nitrospirota bacterium]